MPDFRRMFLDLAALGLLAAAAFLAAALVSFDPADPPGTAVWPPAERPANLCGPAGAYAAHGLYAAVGLGAWLVLVRLAWADWRLFRRDRTPDLDVRLAGWALSLLAACGACGVIAPGAAERLGFGTPWGSGGAVGAHTAAVLTDHFSTAGSLILLAALFAAGSILAGDVRLLKAIGLVLLAPFTLLTRTIDRVHDAVARWRERAAREPEPVAEAVADEPAGTEAIEAAVPAPAAPVKSAAGEVGTGEVGSGRTRAVRGTRRRSCPHRPRSCAASA